MEERSEKEILSPALTIRYYEVEESLVLLMKSKGASRYMLDFVVQVCSNAANTVAVVWNRGKPIAFWAVELHRDHLASCGTYVENAWRRLGVASWLWTCALRRWRRDEVAAKGVTRAGKAFLRSILTEELEHKPTIFGHRPSDLIIADMNAGTMTEMRGSM